MKNFKTTGVCSEAIDFEVEGDIIKKVVFKSGCNGNLNGISSLVEGLTVDAVINKLNGITCGERSSSCPDQLAKALIEYKNQNISTKGL